MKPKREEMVRRRSCEQMSRPLPQFEPACFGEYWQELPCYRWRIRQEFNAYVTLKVAPNDDRFSVLLSWLLTDREPIYATPGGPASEPNRDGLSIDLSLLWSRSAVQWKVKYVPRQEELADWLAENPQFDDPTRDEEARKIFPRVDDAVQRIVDYGLPNLKTIADRYAVPSEGKYEGS